MGMLGDNARLALDTIFQRPGKGIPSWLINPMEHSVIERLAGVNPGDYQKDAISVYLRMQRNAGTCMIDQWIPDNPLTMGDEGYEGKEKGATEGAGKIVVDGIEIDSPEAVVEHMEKIAIPGYQKSIREFDEAARVKDLIHAERSVQETFGPSILKVPYYTNIPGLGYGWYGYVNYFMAYALYPEVMERCFSIQGDLAVLTNRAVVRAIDEAGLPAMLRLDHDMADSRGTLASIDSLDKIWFPHLARSIEPLVKAGIKLLWHCDGNLMAMVPRLLEAGVGGFQGFQYEDGMDYENICKMKTREGQDLVIIAGVSVTRTLPFGGPEDIRKEMAWLVEKGPKTGLFLGGSSSIAPGVSWDNIKTMVDGFKYYREHGRQ
jgi:hypothetical protein